MTATIRTDGLVDDGNLFGVVDVVNALVLAVLVASVGLVLGGGGNDDTTPAERGTAGVLDLGQVTVRANVTSVGQ